MRILDHLIQTIRSAAVYNADVQTAPVCILWPDSRSDSLAGALCGSTLCLARSE